MYRRQKSIPPAGNGLEPKRGILSAVAQASLLSRRTAALRLWSKSTKVSAGHNRPWQLSRVTTSPVVPATGKGPGRAVPQFYPGALRRSSPARRSTSNSPNWIIRLPLLLITAICPHRAYEVSRNAHFSLCHPRPLAFDVQALNRLLTYALRVTRQSLRHPPPDSEDQRGGGVSPVLQFSKACLLLVTFRLTIAFPAVAETHPDERPQLVVSVYNDAGVSAPVCCCRLSKKRQKIFDRAGLDVVWQNCSNLPEPRGP